MSSPRTLAKRALPFEDADAAALATLSFNEDEATQINTWLAPALAQGQSQIVVWAIARRLSPLPSGWEQGCDGGHELHAFQTSFRKYVPQDAPRRVSLEDLLSLLSTATTETRRRLGQYLDYLHNTHKRSLSWLLTVHTVHAKLDPLLDKGEDDPPTVFTHMASALGIYRDYVLEEYRLVIDLVLTKCDRQQRHHHSSSRKKKIPPSPPLVGRPLVSASEQSVSSASTLMVTSQETHIGGKPFSSGTSSPPPPPPAPPLESSDQAGTDAVESITSSDSTESSKHNLPTEHAKERQQEQEGLARSTSSSSLTNKKKQDFISVSLRSTSSSSSLAKGKSSPGNVNKKK